MGRDVRDDRRTVATTRPRYSRITAAGAALLVTLVAMLGGVGILPVESGMAQQPSPAGSGAMELQGARVPSPGASSSSSAPSSSSGSSSSSGPSSSARVPAKPPSARTAGSTVAPVVPEDSGSGKRVVFDMTAQRVWLVAQKAGKDTVERSYLVSGSVTDNLRAGSYEVYSTSLHAVGVDDSGTMRYMVRFTRGQNAAIGFHDIPVLDGRRVQRRDDLGRPQSHGCIRQWRPDARALWHFAPVGTTVVVVT